MKVSELIAEAQKVASVVGDAEIRLRSLEGEAATELKGIEVLITGAESVEASAVTLVHGTPSTPVASSDSPAG